MRPRRLARRVLRALAVRWAPSLAPTGHRKQSRRVQAMVGRVTRERSGSREEIRRLYRMRLDHVRPVTEPLVLISQIQRSGGTLLSQLFDMHPQCHAHPSELAIGYPGKADWPPLDLDATPDRWFRTLFEPEVVTNLGRGYRKGGRVGAESTPTRPFLFLPSLQRAIFDQRIGLEPVRSQRAILNAYMTSYFNAWLDNGNLYRGEKRWITAFVPRMSGRARSVEEFFRTYPDGRLITIVRDPKSWYVSLRTRRAAVTELEPAVAEWCASTRAIVDARRVHGSRVYVLGFESLVADVAGTMRRLAGWLDIAYRPSLLTPTFNGFPIAANSSFAVRGPGITSEPLSRHRLLTDAERQYIERETADAWRAAMAVAS